MRDQWPRIYLAGPEVFLPDAAAIGAKKCELCAEIGFEGLFPLDGALDLDGFSQAEKARRISLANEGLMRSSDTIIANLTPFRGASMDAGTAFEVGFMRALGRPVFGYTNVLPDYAGRARVVRTHGLADDFDADDVEIEDFGLAENLMIGIAIVESGASVQRHGAAQGMIRSDLEGFRQALRIAEKFLKAGRVP